jgi:hypothetical protein
VRIIIRIYHEVPGNHHFSQLIKSEWRKTEGILQIGRKKALTFNFPRPKWLLHFTFKFFCSYHKNHGNDD